MNSNTSRLKNKSKSVRKKVVKYSFKQGNKEVQMTTEEISPTKARKYTNYQQEKLQKYQ